jgi:hypothetical protein
VLLHAPLVYLLEIIDPRLDDAVYVCWDH